MDERVEALHVNDLRRLWTRIRGDDRATRDGGARVVVDASRDLAPASSARLSRLALRLQRRLVVEDGVATLRLRAEEDRLTSTVLQERASALDKRASDDVNAALARGAATLAGDRAR